MSKGQKPPLTPPSHGGEPLRSTRSQVLIVDDVPANLQMLRDTLQPEGYEILGVPNGEITKPFEKEEVLIRVETHLKISRLTRELTAKNRALEQEIMRREQAEDALLKADEELSMLSEQEASRWGIAGFVGQSRTLQKILGDIRKLQNADTTSVLITGESGTGKELIARALHFGGTRAKGRFVPVNCSAIPSELAESAFFGHVREHSQGQIKTAKVTLNWLTVGRFSSTRLGICRTNCKRSCSVCWKTRS